MAVKKICIYVLKGKIRSFENTGQKPTKNQPKLQNSSICLSLALSAEISHMKVILSAANQLW